MWEYSDTEYIKLFRRMTRWEWYTDINTKTLFLHCLLKANWKAGKWHGYSYKRGQFITSLRNLAKESGLTVQQTRTALKHLISTGELTSWSDSKIRLITVVSFDKFQQANNQANNQLTIGQQAANNRYKNNKKYKEGEEYTQPETDDELIEFLKNREKHNDRRTDDID